MLSNEENEILARVGRGTLMGDLFRRFWLPAVLSHELVADGAPVRLRILGEDLVAFRDTAGKVGIVDAYCPHRLAPLFFGRNEACGLRCVYHGWKFDTDGNCIDVPNVSSPSEVAKALHLAKITAYPTRETGGGLVWIYMGPAGLVPDFPELEWTRVRQGHALVHRWLQRSNWAQGMEGEIDSAHISFLHKRNTPQDGRGATAATEDPAPVLTLRETDCGFVYGSRRNFEDRYYWRVTQWLAPMFSCIPGQPIGPFSGHGRAWVPVDDYNTTTFAYRYNPDRAYTSDEIAEVESGSFFPPRIERGVFDLPHGYRIDTYLPVACRENDYLIDRRMQKAENFTGIWGVNEQDRALQESTPSVPGAVGVADRSREHLVSSDVPVVTARRRLIRMARALREGIEPSPTRNARGYAVRAMSRFSAIAEFDDLMRAHGADCVAPASQDEAIA